MGTKKKQSLSHGRPPTFQKPASMTAKATRTIIRTHHTLQKQHAQAIKSGDGAKAKDIERLIEEQGGLKAYQQASITGQSKIRGGDSSTVLMRWLKEEKITKSADHELKMLEVGALSTTNACSKSGLFEVTRIDLNSQDPKIQQQDFMKRLLPTSEDDRFDIISLSLVLNYVPDAVGRGEMLRRTCQFMKVTTNSEDKVFPALFFVLPAPCIQNARYMTNQHLDKILQSLGYSKLHEKISTKLLYQLWKYMSPPAQKEFVPFPKVEVNPGKARNNFSIILR
ncbi:putative succinyl-CoA ligase [ADP-forming] subunit alpha [Venturia nashicola]|uniref:25S rRNA adenine-N(1) methyltransferase n=1 Tax=Venturia nashicola TaxID=86259 RepID=A0A4Z1P4Z8_9PEZI|nr:putative succinyl-CoA ligase [ADP-forming] subunit alpha [Venturia nashicola]TLD23449.1 putative succinyl-CoA ligase [ADP-forming] subunit alpha [Venturia nashicola]